MYVVVYQIYLNCPEKSAIDEKPCMTDETPEFSKEVVTRLRFEPLQCDSYATYDAQTVPIL